VSPNNTVTSVATGTMGPSAGIPRQRWVPTTPAAPVAPAEVDRPRRVLTEREKQVLRLVCDGLSNSQIATRLAISPETVKSELKRIFRKIDVRNRTQAAVLLVREGLL